MPIEKVLLLDTYVIRHNSYIILIVLCSYPYEYDGGHIKGAKNMYTRDQVMDYFIHSKNKQILNLDGSPQPEKRRIVIFHCEFSSERGPTL